MNKFLLVVFTCLALSVAGHSQNKGESDFVSLEADLAFYADVMITADKVDHRRLAGETFYKGFTELLNQEDSFEYPFDSLKWISKIRPSDGSFRIFSWQVRQADQSSKYFAVLQKKKSKEDLILFSDNRPFLNGAERSVYSSDQWYGAIYYKIEKFKMKGVDGYLVLGFDSNNALTNKKIADILIVKDDKVELGAPVFVKELEKEKETLHRIIIEYADAAAGHLNYDEKLDMLIFDHMITIFAEGPEKGAISVPDGSYEGYKLQKGLWRYQEKVFSQTSEDAPREKPVLNGRAGKDLFGRKKG